MVVRLTPVDQGTQSSMMDDGWGDRPHRWPWKRPNHERVKK
jgi:hypothetical protein